MDPEKLVPAEAAASAPPEPAVAAGGTPAHRWAVPDGVWRQTPRWAGLLALLVALGHLSWVLAVALLPLGILSFLFVVRLGYKGYVGWALALAGLLGLQCVLETPPSLRQHDVDGHREYVDYLSTHGRLPAVQQGWETWQPPLYYLLATAWRWAFSGIPQDDPFRSVQFLATALYVATVALGLAAFRRLRLSDVEALAATAVLALMPAYVFFAARIDNDVLLARAFAAFAGLFGLGADCLWTRGRRLGKAALLLICGVFSVGLADFYIRLFF